MEPIVYIATHKIFKNKFPESYIPILAGNHDIKDCNYLRDNTGDNISEKNKNYCELTALYWVWKNTSNKYIGLCHYRRYFSNKNLFSNKVIDAKNIKKILKNNDIILPQRRVSEETVYERYCNNHYEIDILKTRNIILNKYPDYIESFDEVMKKKSTYPWNMFIGKREIISEYIEWVFDILFELEKVTDISQYDDYQKRIYGFISERLLHVWVNKNNMKIKELPVIMPEMGKLDVIKVKLKGIIDRRKVKKGI